MGLIQRYAKDPDGLRLALLAMAKGIKIKPEFEREDDEMLSALATLPISTSEKPMPTKKTAKKPSKKKTPSSSVTALLATAERLRRQMAAMAAKVKKQSEDEDEDEDEEEDEDEFEDAGDDNRDPDDDDDDDSDDDTDDDDSEEDDEEDEEDEDESASSRKSKRAEAKAEREKIIRTTLMDLPGIQKPMTKKELAMMRAQGEANRAAFTPRDSSDFRSKTSFEQGAPASADQELDPKAPGMQPSYFRSFRGGK